MPKEPQFVTILTADLAATHDELNVLRERAERAEAKAVELAERVADLNALKDDTSLRTFSLWRNEKARAALLDGLLREVIHALMQAGMGSERMKTRRHLQSQAESFLDRLAALAEGAS